jgi:site-specific DNA-methyltransferase (adenine-specific)
MKSQLKGGFFMETNQIHHGNCLALLPTFKSQSVDLIYFDPPFFTQKRHTLMTRDNSQEYSFEDRFSSLEEYLALIEQVLRQAKRVLKPSGSVFLHCDKTACHHIRVVLDREFGQENFQSEIIWTYKRWSNSKKGLMNAHQVIFFYSKTPAFKFNTIYMPYSATTNVDQILQERERDANGKSVYKRDEAGQIVLGKEKKGVPLSDVWEIPYLNPKAKERTGYPTQKPVALLSQIIQMMTDEGDLVLDPFCGSGTTCVAAKANRRDYIGMDISLQAVQLAEVRLSEMVITESALLKQGVESYIEKTAKELAILEQFNAIPVQRNSGIDGFLKASVDGLPVPIKIQGEHETLEDAIEKLEKASFKKGYPLKIVVQTNEKAGGRLFPLQSNVRVIPTLELQARALVKERDLAFP